MKTKQDPGPIQPHSVIVKLCKRDKLGRRRVTQTITFNCVNSVSITQYSGGGYKVQFLGSMVKREK